MAKACKVPTKGSDAGKYNFAKTSPVTVLYRKKSYHSIVVPIVLAITARRNCTRCSISVSTAPDFPAAVIVPPKLGYTSYDCRKQSNAQDDRSATGDHTERAPL